jgi:hypothetical protein
LRSLTPSLSPHPRYSPTREDGENLEAVQEEDVQYNGDEVGDVEDDPYTEQEEEEEEAAAVEEEFEEEEDYLNRGEQDDDEEEDLDLGLDDSDEELPPMPPTPTSYNEERYQSGQFKIDVVEDGVGRGGDADDDDDDDLGNLLGPAPVHITGRTRRRSNFIKSPEGRMNPFANYVQDYVESFSPEAIAAAEVKVRRRANKSPEVPVPVKEVEKETTKQKAWGWDEQPVGKAGRGLRTPRKKVESPFKMYEGK